MENINKAYTKASPNIIDLVNQVINDFDSKNQVSIEPSRVNQIIELDKNKQVIELDKNKQVTELDKNKQVTELEKYKQAIEVEINKQVTELEKYKQLLNDINSRNQKLIDLAKVNNIGIIGQGLQPQSVGAKPMGTQNENIFDVLLKTTPYIKILEKEISNIKDVNIMSLDLLNNNKPIQDISPVIEGINLLKISNFKSEPIKKENDLYGNPVMKGQLSVFYLDSINDSKETIFNLQFRPSNKVDLGIGELKMKLVNMIKNRNNTIYLKDTEIKQKTEINIETTEKLNVYEQPILILENIKGGYGIPVEVYATDPITIISIDSFVNVIVRYKNRKYLQNKVKQIENFTNTDSLTNINLISIFLIFILGSVILYLINVKNCRLIN